VRGSVDTAICSKPGGDLAGQLLYGFSLHCSNRAMDLASELGESALTAPGSMAGCAMQFVLPNHNIAVRLPAKRV
jgi:hypothetical protein